MRRWRGFSALHRSPLATALQPMPRGKSDPADFSTENRRNAAALHAVDPDKRRCAAFIWFTEMMMPMRFKVFAVVAALAAGTSSAAMAQYACAPGYTYVNGVCQPLPAPGYSNPVSGAVSGEAAGAASGYAAGGPVGAVVGGALGAATGTVTGTANMVAPPAPACAAGYYYSNGYCYPNR
jgi:hypothetical protein